MRRPALAQPRLQRGERTRDAEPGFGHHHADRAQVREAEPPRVDPAPGAQVADQDQHQAADDEQHDRDVQHQHGVGQGQIGAVVQRCQQGRQASGRVRRMDPTPAVPQICIAIHDKRRISFVYHGRRRVAEPQCYGISTRNNETLRVFLIEGISQAAGAAVHRCRDGRPRAPRRDLRPTGTELQEERFGDEDPSSASSDGSVPRSFVQAGTGGSRRSADRFLAAPARHQLLPLRPRRRQVARLHVAVAADVLGDARDLGWPAPGARRSGRAAARRCRPGTRSISARSVLRSSVRPKRSSAVPRRPFSLASTPNALRIHGPNGRLTSSPLALRLANIGGARWCTSL